MLYPWIIIIYVRLKFLQCSIKIWGGWCCRFTSLSRHPNSVNNFFDEVYGCYSGLNHQRFQCETDTKSKIGHLYSKALVPYLFFNISLLLDVFFNNNTFFVWKSMNVDVKVPYRYDATVRSKSIRYIFRPVVSCTVSVS